MSAGKVIKSFTIKDGRKVILRTPRWEDLDELLEYINSLAEERLDFVFVRKMTRDEEADWLSKTLAEMEKGNAVDVIAEVDGKIAGNSTVRRERLGRSHVGMLGIAIRQGYRDMGIGTEMIRVIIEESRRIGLKVLVLHVASTNLRAMSVYEKAGFKEVGKIPEGIYFNNRYMDDVIMFLNL
ncbi:MAG: GNAT family N-acetyltransferase [Thermoproteota archaeon]